MRILTITALILIMGSQFPAFTEEQGSDSLSLNIIRTFPEALSAQQGIATDGNAIYVQSTSVLAKYDMNGTLLKQTDTLAWHHGGIAYHDGKIYAAVSECSKQATAHHWIHIYDAAILELTASHDIAAQFSICAGGMAYYDRHFYVAESYYDSDHSDYIVKYDENFQFVTAYTVDFKSPYGIQGLAYLPELDRFMVNSHGKDFYLIDTAFTNASLLAGKAPYDLQDVAVLSGKRIVLNDRPNKRIVVAELDVPAATPAILHAFPSPDAHQGVAVDAAHVYAIGSKSISKHDKVTGELVRRWEASDAVPLIHLDSGVVVGDKLYCSHSNYPHIPMTSSVEIWDTKTMEHVDSYSFGIDSGSCTWIDRHAGYWWVCFAHYNTDKGEAGKSNAWTTVAQYDDQWNRMESWVFPPELLERFAPHSCSGASWGPDNMLYCSGHDRAELYAVALPQGGSILRHVTTVPFPNRGQGIAFDRSQPGVLYGIHRGRKEIRAVRLPEIE